ncbi:MAG TPA: CBS domain-containing protein [Candidatus Kapabacteria bacterium]|nr:CBS domain-containing protein [Candidatus Kapabacteria bacterium]
MILVNKIVDLMNTNLFTIDIDDTLHNAYTLMKSENLKHLPVVNGSKIVGMLCESKVKEYILRKIYEPDQNYGEIAQNPLVEFENIVDEINHFVYPEDSVQKAVKIFTKYKASALAVVDWDMNLVGIVTNTDLLLSYHSLLEKLAQN